MEDEQLDEDDHSQPSEPPKRKIRFEMCGSELYLSWQWDEPMREASP